MKRPSTVIGYYKRGGPNESETVRGGAAYQPLTDLEGMRLLPQRGAAAQQQQPPPPRPPNSDATARMRFAQAANGLTLVQPNFVADDELNGAIYITPSVTGRTISQPLPQPIATGAAAVPDSDSAYAFASASASASASGSNLLRRDSISSFGSAAGGPLAAARPAGPRSALHVMQSYAPESTASVQSIIDTAPTLKIKRLLSVYGTGFPDAPAGTGTFCTLLLILKFALLLFNYLLSFLTDCLLFACTTNQLTLRFIV